MYYVKLCALIFQGLHMIEIQMFLTTCTTISILQCECKCQHFMYVYIHKEARIVIKGTRIII